MKKRLQQVFSFVLRLGLSGAVLWLVFFYIDDKEKILSLIQMADAQYMVYAFVSFSMIYYVLLLRWCIFIRAFDLNIPWMNLSRYFFLGVFGNLFLPTAIGGDVIKAAGLCVNSNQKQRVVASVLLDRLSGFAAMVVVSCVVLVVGFSYLKNPVIWLTVIFMGVTLTGIGAVLFHEGLYGFFCRIFYFFPKVRTAVMQMHYDIMLLKDRKMAVVQAVAVSCVSQGFLALTFFLLAQAFQQEINMIYFIIFTPITCVASSFPSIGGLGFREGVLEYLLVGAGASAGIGLSIGLVNFLFMVVVGVLGGIFFIMTKNKESVLQGKEG